MRKSKAEAAETRQQIIDVAAHEFRLNGIHETGLVGLMAKAGLTHGGFYCHFESKKQLVSEACSAALGGLVDRFESAARRGDGKESFKAIVDGYVSVTHRDDRAGGCPLAGLGSELARADVETRAAASVGFHNLVDIIAESMEKRQLKADRSQAVFAMAAMIGAVTLSRIIADPEISKSILGDVQHHLAGM
jgi:TetR/AcrR family transcriptional repressor of nem operon